MNFDENIFLDYMKNSIEENMDVSHLYRLYKTYSAIDIIIDSDIIKNENKLKKYEDSIYTIDGEVIDDRKRINLALDSIFSNINKDEIKEKTLNEYFNLKRILNDLDLNKKENVMYMKKQISIMQAKLNIRNTFLIAAYEAFLEEYRNIYIKTINKENKRK